MKTGITDRCLRVVLAAAIVVGCILALRWKVQAADSTALLGTVRASSARASKAAWDAGQQARVLETNLSTMKREAEEISAKLENERKTSAPLLWLDVAFTNQYAAFAEKRGMSAEQLTRLAHAMADGLENEHVIVAERTAAGVTRAKDAVRWNEFAARIATAQSQTQAEITAIVGADAKEALAEYNAIRTNEIAARVQYQPILRTAGLPQLNPAQVHEIALLNQQQAGGRAGVVSAAAVLDGMTERPSPDQTRILQTADRVSAAIREKAVADQAAARAAAQAAKASGQ